MTEQSLSKRELVDKLLKDVLEGGDLDVLETLVHPDIRVSDIAFDGAYQGLEEYRSHMEMLRGAFSDVLTSYEVLTEGADSITVEYRLEGVHSGPFMDTEGTGNDVSFGGIDVFAVENSRIRSIRGVFDLFGLLQDIRMIEA